MSCFGCWLASWGRTCQLKSLKAGELKSGTLRVTEQRGFLCLVGLGRRDRKQGWRGAACGPAPQSEAGGGRGRGAGAPPRPAPCWLTPVKCHRTGDITVPREPSPRNGAVCYRRPVRRSNWPPAIAAGRCVLFCVTRTCAFRRVSAPGRSGQRERVRRAAEVAEGADTARPGGRDGTLPGPLGCPGRQAPKACLPPEDGASLRAVQWCVDEMTWSVFS